MIDRKLWDAAKRRDDGRDDEGGALAKSGD
jgi:hypothetical protein